MLRPLEELPRLTSATHSCASLGRTLSLDGPWLSMLTRMTSDRVVMSCQRQQELQALVQHAACSSWPTRPVQPNPK